MCDPITALQRNLPADYSDSSDKQNLKTVSTRKRTKLYTCRTKPKPKKAYRFNGPSTNLGSNCNYSELSAADGNVRLPPISLRRRSYFAGVVMQS